MATFRSINLSLSRAVHWRLPKRFTFPLAVAYEQTVFDLAAGISEGMDAGAAADVAEGVVEGVAEGIVLDVGAGLSTITGEGQGIPESIAVIGLDILESALRENEQLDYKLAADACRPWPLADASIDLVISRSVIEHLKDTRVFASECRRVLKPGGHAVHLLPGRNAPFSWLNRILPKAVSRRLLDWVFPEKRALLGFTAFYRDCTAQGIAQLFERSGLSVEQVYCRYYQSTYYGSFFPLYLVSVAYDLLMWKLDLKRLSAQLLVVVSRPD